MKEVKKRILTQVTVTFPELENFIDIFSITGLALLDKYQLHTTINIVVLTGYLKFLDIFKEIVLITKRL